MQHNLTLKWHDVVQNTHAGQMANEQRLFSQLQLFVLDVTAAEVECLLGYSWTSVRSEDIEKVPLNTVPNPD